MFIGGDEDGVRRVGYQVVDGLKFFLEVEAVFIGANDTTDASAALGEAVLAMARVNAQYWAVVGYGEEGGQLASTLACAAHPRVKSLAMLSCAFPSGPLPSPLYKLSVVGDLDDRSPAVRESVPRDAVFQPVQGVGENLFIPDGEVALVRTLTSAVGSLQIPAVEPDVKPWLKGAVVGDGDEWLVFEPPQGTPILAGLLFFQGAACPVEAYGELLERIARRGILVVALSGAGCDPAQAAAAQLPERALAALSGRLAPDRSWFVGGHSMGGEVASKWAFEQQMQPPPSAGSPRLRGVVLFAGSTRGTDFKGRLPRGRQLPFLQIYGSRDAFEGVLPSRYVSDYLEPFVESDLITTAELQGGTHYGWGWYGYQEPFYTGSLFKREQQVEGARRAVDWMLSHLPVTAVLEAKDPEITY